MNRAHFCFLLFFSVIFLDRTAASSMVRHLRRLFRKRVEEMARVEKSVEASGHWPLADGQFMRSSPSRYCTYVNHVFRIKNVFNTSGKTAYFFRTAQKVANASQSGLFRNYSHAEEQQRGTFENPRLVEDWHRMFGDRYEIASNHEISPYIANAVVNLVEDVDLLRRRHRKARSGFRRIEGAEFENRLMSMLKKEWGAISSDFGCTIHSAVKILVLKSDLPGKGKGRVKNYFRRLFGKDSRVIPELYRPGANISEINLVDGSPCLRPRTKSRNLGTEKDGSNSQDAINGSGDESDSIISENKIFREEEFEDLEDFSEQY